MSTKKPRLHIRNFILPVIIAIIAVVVSVILFPDWTASPRALLALVALVVVAVPSAINDLRALIMSSYHDTAIPPPPSIETTDQSGGVNISGGPVQVQGDLVGRDKVTQIVQSPPRLTALHTLRAPDQFFTGREREIGELKKKVRSGGPVAITSIRGMGGIGKTELAIVVANQLRDDFPDAQLLIEMRGSSEQPRALADALAEIIRAFVGLDVKLPDDPSLLAALYRGQLNDKRAIIVLDDLADDSQLPSFYPPAGSALLITSRQAIPVRSLSLDELPADDARNLLISIAPRVPSTVADDICKLCGYLPLLSTPPEASFPSRSTLPPTNTPIYCATSASASPSSVR